MLSRLQFRPLTPADYARMDCQLPHVRQYRPLIQVGSQATPVNQFKLSIFEPNGQESVVALIQENNCNRQLMLAQNAQNTPLSIQDNTVQNLAKQSPAFAKAIQKVCARYEANSCQIFVTINFT